MTERKSPTKVEQRLEQRLAANAKRQAACILGKLCQCETNREFAQCARRYDAGPLTKRFGLHSPIDDLMTGVTHISKDEFDPGFVLHYHMGDADAYVAMRIVDPTLTKTNAYAKSKPPVACSLYDVLDAYADVIKRKGKRK